MALTLALTLAACAGTPPSRFHLLDGTGGAAGTFSERGALDRLVFVDRVQVARYLDRPEFVQRDPGNVVSFAAFEVWAEPLPDLVTASLVDALGRELGYADVLVTPDRRDIAPAARVTVELLRFDGDAAGTMLLDARWRLLAGADERLVATGRERIVETAIASEGEPATGAERAAALQCALAKLADRLAGPIRGTRGG